MENRKDKLVSNRGRDSQHKGYYSSKRVKKGLGHYLLGRGMSAVISILVAILLIRLLSIVDYGVYTVLSGMMLLLTLLSSAGLERILPRYLSELRQAGAHRQLGAYCWKFLAVRIALFAVLLLPLTLFSGAIAEYFGITDEWKILLVFYLYALVNAGSIHLQRTFQALLRQKEAVYGLILDGFVRLAIFIAIYLSGIELTLFIVFLVQLLGAILAFIFLSLKLRTLLKRLEPTQEEKIEIEPRKIVHFGWYNYLQQLSGLSYSPGTNKVLSGYLLGNVETAMLGFSYVVYELVKRYMPAMLLLGVIEPVFMARYRQNKKFSILNEMTRLVVKINLFFIVPFIAWAVFFIEPILGLVSAEKYPDTGWIISGLLVVLVFDSHRLALQLLCNAVDQSRLLFTSNLLFIVLFPLEVWAMVEFGLLGLLVSLAVITFLRNIYLVHVIRKAGYMYYPDWQAMIKILILTGAAVLPAYLLFVQVEGVLGSLLAGCVLGLLFLLFANRWKIFSVHESRTIRNVSPRGMWYW